MRKIFSIFMAILVFASTVSWTVSKHYCMGRLMNVALFTHADDCGMQMLSTADDSTKISDKDSCCTDEYIIVSGQDELKININDLSFDQHCFLVSFVESNINLLNEEFTLTVPNNDYPPPILVKNIQLLDGVFLI